MLQPATLLIIAQKSLMSQKVCSYYISVVSLLIDDLLNIVSYIEQSHYIYDVIKSNLCILKLYDLIT